MPELPDVQPQDPAYSNLPRAVLQDLCKDREVSAVGSSPTLVERLRQWDRDHPNAKAPRTEEELAAKRAGREFAVDSDEDDDDDDPLLEGDDPETEHGEQVRQVFREVVDGEQPAHSRAETQPAQTPSTPPPAPQPPQPTQGEGDGKGEGELSADDPRRTGVFRFEFPCRDGEIGDAQHFAYIADTHAQAAAAGFQPRGDNAVGRRVGFSRDGDGNRTVVYEVMVRRTKE